MPRERTRAEMHHDPQYYPIRNHLVDFLVNRSRGYAAHGELALLHDPRQPPVVRPGLVVGDARGEPGGDGQRLRQVINL